MTLMAPEALDAPPHLSWGFTASDNDNPSAEDGFWLACLFHPVLVDWIGVLKRLGVSPDEASQLASRTESIGSDFQSELAASGFASEQSLLAALSAESGIPISTELDARDVMIRDTDCVTLLREDRAATVVRMAARQGITLILIAPKRFDPAGLRRMRKLAGDSAWRLRLVAPAQLRTALLERASPVLGAAAANGLFQRLPQCSARIVATAWQGSVLGAAVVALPLFAFAAPGLAFGALHAFSSLFFLACVWLRVAALRVAVPPPSAAIERPDPSSLPVYSVLVALYREAEVVPDLLDSLDRLEWPRDRLDVKLVCEADDAETLNAIEAADLPHGFEVIAVPPSLPRTKPKALAYALPMARGDYVVLYDAEDDPHPMQLIEAWSVFSRAGPDLACLQAPLEISNGREGLVSRLFAFEYAALFRGLLPYLSQRRRLLPLGGTSNHFRGLM